MSEWNCTWEMGMHTGVVKNRASTVEQVEKFVQEYLNDLDLGGILEDFHVDAYSQDFIDVSYTVKPAFPVTYLDTNILVIKKDSTGEDIIDICHDIIQDSIKKDLEQVMGVPEPRQLELPFQPGGLDIYVSDDVPKGERFLVTNSSSGDMVVMSSEDYKVLEKKISTCKDDWRK